MEIARIIYRYLIAVLVADVLLQFFLSSAGVFSAGPGTAARDSAALDPHRTNGAVVMGLALLLLVAALVAHVMAGGSGRWRCRAHPAQPVLAIARRGRRLHVLGAVAILAIASLLALQAWRTDRTRQAAAPYATRLAADEHQPGHVG